MAKKKETGKDLIKKGGAYRVREVKPRYGPRALLPKQTVQKFNAEIRAQRSGSRPSKLVGRATEELATNYKIVSTEKAKLFLKRHLVRMPNSRVGTDDVLNFLVSVCISKGLDIDEESWLERNYRSKFGLPQSSNIRRRRNMAKSANTHRLLPRPKYIGEITAADLELYGDECLAKINCTCWPTK